MMKPETIALALVILFGAIWLATVVTGLVAAFPFGLPVLAIVAIVIYLFYKVVRDRLTNAEDDYYEKNIKD